ncbi:hypothetical protein CEE37_10875 [candidate division LCP-89 bacterium B3_LCP]|uniref:Response regulatory domain-containing protein n=1 Tax=candidate division LCP-89 bacterium B3_LCP TaxID=2012998 RepID=A0A532UXZ2_UNCL8|nr:MAG: hypothetical protein CEE37_10875 [candidate division LCP-89 bacterium B3_LCP]
MTTDDQTKATILLVDDEDVIRLMGQDILRVLGYETILAADGQEAVQLYQDNKNEVALVILDWHMPGISGMEILEKLWAVNPDVKTIISTGWGPPQEMEEIQKSGHVVGLLQKPYLVKDLQNEITKFLAQ